MKILIANGNPRPDSAFENYLVELSGTLRGQGHEVETLTLRELRLQSCVGCYSCWLKTPGVCAFNDDGPKMLASYLRSDLVIFASPVVMGYFSALTKAMQERLLPLYHPFLRVSGDRMLHYPRYEHYPSLALLLAAAEEGDEAGIEITEKIFVSPNVRGVLFTKTMNAPVKEVADACNRN